MIDDEMIDAIPDSVITVLIAVFELAEKCAQLARFILDARNSNMDSE